MILTVLITNDDVRIQHQPTGFYNPDGVCLRTEVFDILPTSITLYRTRPLRAVVPHKSHLTA